MSRSERVVKPVPIGMGLEFTDKESSLYYENEVRQHRASEAARIQKFEVKWDKKELEIKSVHNKDLLANAKNPSMKSPEQLQKLKATQENRLATFRNKKAADWGTVIKELVKMKTVMLSRPYADSQATKAMLDTDCRIP